MKCPKCGTGSEVLSTRALYDNTVTRRRQCLRATCRGRFTTHESVARPESAPARMAGSNQLPVDRLRLHNVTATHDCFHPGTAVQRRAAVRRAERPCLRRRSPE